MVLPRHQSVSSALDIEKPEVSQAGQADLEVVNQGFTVRQLFHLSVLSLALIKMHGHE